MTTKDVNITVTALLKSIIESGADPSEWSDRLSAALRLYAQATKQITSQQGAG